MFSKLLVAFASLAVVSADGHDHEDSGSGSGSGSAPACDKVGVDHDDVIAAVFGGGATCAMAAANGFCVEAAGPNPLVRYACAATCKTCYDATDNEKDQSAIIAAVYGMDCATGTAGYAAVSNCQQLAVGLLCPVSCAAAVENGEGDEIVVHYKCDGDCKTDAVVDRDDVAMEVFGQGCAGVKANAHCMHDIGKFVCPVTCEASFTDADYANDQEGVLKVAWGDDSMTCAGLVETANDAGVCHTADGAPAFFPLVCKSCVPFKSTTTSTSTTPAPDARGPPAVPAAVPDSGSGSGSVTVEAATTLPTPAPTTAGVTYREAQTFSTPIDAGLAAAILALTGDDKVAKIKELVEHALTKTELSYDDVESADIVQSVEVRRRRDGHNAVTYTLEVVFKSSVTAEQSAAAVTAFNAAVDAGAFELKITVSGQEFTHTPGAATGGTKQVADKTPADTPAPTPAPTEASSATTAFVSASSMLVAGLVAAAL